MSGTTEPADAIRAEEVAQLKRHLDGLAMGALSIYDVAKVLPHPYSAVGDMANHWAHDFVNTAKHLVSMAERAPVSPPAPEPAPPTGDAAAALALLDEFTASGPRDPQNPAPTLRLVLDALEASVRGLSAQVEGSKAAGYAQAIDDARWLAEARAGYSSFRETKNAAEFFALSDPERAIHTQVVTARQIADLLAGDDDGMGWLPSWKWDEWEERRASPTAPAEHDGGTIGAPGPYTDEDRERYEKLVQGRAAAMRKAGGTPE